MAGTRFEPGTTARARLVAVRHGSTAWSATRRHTGRSDILLDEEGREQALAVGRRLTGHEFPVVLTSPLLRARETCELAGFAAGAVVCEDLVEWDYGTIEGLTTAQVRESTGDPGWDIWVNGADGGETLEQVCERADRVVALVRSEPRDVLVFAHAHILRVVAVRWLGLDPGHGRYLSLSPAAVSLLDWERETPVIGRWNDDGGDPLGP